MTQDYTFLEESRQNTDYASYSSVANFNENIMTRQFSNLSVCEENCCEDWKVKMLLRVMIDAKGNEHHVSWLDIRRKGLFFIETEDCKKFTSVL
ncbi:hypothetical protein GUITHDRAFT_150092, partial [Guillardia theta CCMP2712]